MPHIETDDKEFLKHYKSRGNIADIPRTSGIDLCNYHEIPVKKIQFGRYFLCPQCRGRQIYHLGKPLKRHLKQQF